MQHTGDVIVGLGLHMHSITFYGRRDLIRKHEHKSGDFLTSRLPVTNVFTWENVLAGPLSIGAFFIEVCMMDQWPIWTGGQKSL